MSSEEGPPPFRAKTRRAIARMERHVARLVGKTVARVELRPWETDGGPYSEAMYDPLIIFTDGTSVSFTVVEDNAKAVDYGTDPLVVLPNGKRPR